MADISNMTLNNVNYNVKDASAPLRKFTNYSKTGTLPISSDDNSQTAIGKLENNIIPKSAKGTANGVAELDANGKVPSSQLPSYVDDVLEYSAKSSFPATGESGKIYVDTTTNKTYRWSGSAYVEISESLALGETDSTAYRGDRGKAAYDHSQRTSGNPHNVTKSDVGLGNVGNFKAVSTAASQGLSNTEKSNARANIGAGTGNGTYSKPSGGIPKSDLASAVQTSLDQVNTNKTNIWYNTDMGVRNAAQITDFTYTAGVAGGNYIIPCAPLTGDIVIKCGSITSTDTDSATSAIILYFTDGTSSQQQISRGTNITQNVSIGAKVLRQIACYPSNNYTNSANDTLTVSNLIVCSKAVYDQDSSYTSGAISNAQLTSSIMAMCDVGAKNLVNHIDLATTLTGNATGITLTPNDDGSITLNGTSSSSSAVIYARCPIKGTIKSNTNYIVRGTDSSNVHVQLLAYDSSGNTTILANEQGIATVNSGAYARYEARLWIKAKPASGTQFSNLKIYPMICEESLFNTNPALTPYALPNYDLTRLESEDRAGLIECVDGGAKNKIPNIASSATVGEAVFTVNSDGSVSVYTTAATTAARSLIIVDSSKGITVNASDIVSGVPASASASSVSIEWGIGASGNIDRVWGDNPDGYKTIGYSGSIRYVAIKIESGKTIPSSSPLKFYPMICTKAAFGVSQKFTPYRVPITGKYAVFKKSISCSTTLTSTGIKFVSDKTAYYRVSVTAHYGGSKPLGVTVKQKVNSSATPHAFLVAENDLVSAISVSGMMQLGVGGEFEVFAKYEAAASNDFYMLIEELG